MIGRTEHEEWEEFVFKQARKSPEWAIAYALINLGWMVRNVGTEIIGVDSYTGLQGIAADFLVEAREARKNGGGG